MPSSSDALEPVASAIAPRMLSAQERCSEITSRRKFQRAPRPIALTPYQPGCFINAPARPAERPSVQNLSPFGLGECASVLTLEAGPAPFHQIPHGVQQPACRGSAMGEYGEKAPPGAAPARPSVASHPLCASHPDSTSSAGRTQRISPPALRVSRKGPRRD